MNAHEMARTLLENLVHYPRLNDTRKQWIAADVARVQDALFEAYKQGYNDGYNRIDPKPKEEHGN